MKYVILLCLVVIVVDTTMLNGHYRRRAGHQIGETSAAVSRGLWGNLP